MTCSRVVINLIINLLTTSVVIPGVDYQKVKRTESSVNIGDIVIIIRLI